MAFLLGDGLTMDGMGVDVISMGIVMGVVGGTSTTSSCSRLGVVEDWLLSGVTGTAMADDREDDVVVVFLDRLDGVFVADDREDLRLGLVSGISCGGNGSEGIEVGVDVWLLVACRRVRRGLVSNACPFSGTVANMEALRVRGMLWKVE